MLPETVRDILQMDRAIAEAQAAQGNPEAGHQTLLLGLARAHEARLAGTTWGDELVRQYREAIQDYLTRHGISP